MNKYYQGAAVFDAFMGLVLAPVGVRYSVSGSYVVKNNVFTVQVVDTPASALVFQSFTPTDLATFQGTASAASLNN